MLFNSLTFKVLHLITLSVYWSVKNQTIRQAILLASSLLFYGWLYWPGLILLGIAIVVNYSFTRAIDKYRKKSIFVAAIALNLLNLGWFKYSAFVFDNINIILTKYEINIQLPAPSYWLPLGISFYTFQVMGYLIDIWRGDIKSEKSILTFAVFKCYYAQLIAGPIVRASELLPQLREHRTFVASQFQKGFFMLIAGLCIKICVADILSQFVEYGFNNSTEIGTAKTWLSVYGFSFQILSDFWGYSTVAIGIGHMYGISLPNNFNFPYIAKSCQDFWRRWHITLSMWFRDYVYIPLGGNREKAKIYRNIILTMTIAGIWHGAGWNFLIWGVGHGLWLAIERFANQNIVKTTNKLILALRNLFVFHMVTMLWVFFRADTFQQAIDVMGSMLLPPYNFSTSHQETLIITMALFIIFNRRLGKLFIDNKFATISLRKQVGITALLLLLIMAYSDARLDFIYFVF